MPTAAPISAQQSVSSPAPVVLPENARSRTLLCFLIPAVFSLLLALLHNFVWSDVRIMLASDGKHYLTTIQKFVEVLSAHNGSALFATDGPVAHMLLDGPLMVLLYVPWFLLSGVVPGPRDWAIFAQGQSLIHAGTAGLVSLLVLRVSRNPFCALAAGILFGAYPPAVLQTGHLMTEAPVALLCLVMVYAMSSLRRPVFSAAVGGVAGGLLIVSKPALIPAVFLVLFYGCMQFVPRKKAFSAVLVGVLLIVSTWCGLSIKVNGVPAVTTQRQPVYNVAKAWNTEFDGWGCNPHPVLTDLSSADDGAVNVVYGMWQCHPQECLRLTARKITRLFGLPWNDYKNRALGVDMNGQIFWHQLLLCSGLYGLIFFLVCRYRVLTPSRRLAVELSLLLVSGHLAYLLAESTARYAFTSLPLLMVLAVTGLALSGGARPSERQKVGGVLGSLIAAMLFTSLILHAEKLSKREDPQNLRELSHLMTFGQRAEKVIDFSQTRTARNPQSVLLMVDGDKNVEQCEVLINGHRIAERLVSVNHFDGPHYNLYDQMREFGPSMRVNPEDFRQWRAVSINPSLVNWSGKNRIELIVRPGAATIYGDANVGSRYMLSPDYFSYGLVSSAPAATGAESRCVDPVIAGSAHQSSRIVSGSRVERLFDSLRIKLACVMPPAIQNSAAQLGVTAPRVVSSSSSSLSSSTRFALSVPSRLFDPGMQEGDQVRINKTVLYSARSIAGSVELPLPPPGKSHLSLRLTGEVRALKNPGDTGVLVALTGKSGSVATLGNLPRSVAAGENWSPFVITDIVPLSVVGGTPDSLAVALYPVPWMEGQYGASRKNPDASFRKLRVEGEFVSLPGIAGTRVIYY